MQAKARIVAGLVGGAVALALVTVAAQRRDRAHSPPAPTMSAKPSSGTPPTAAPSASSPYTRDLTVWKALVYDDDPVKGKADALVTIVAFSELQHAPSREAAETLDKVLAQYPNDVRLVWKDNPLPSDAPARSAALFGRAVYRALGNEGFWRAQALLRAEPDLEPASLQSIAQKLGLPTSLPADALKDGALARKLEQSLTLGFDVQAKGIPHFFINGVRLAGAQRLDKVKSRVDEALVKARALVQSGVSRGRVYETLMADAKQLPALEHRDVPPAPPDAPRIGEPKAAVVVQVWSTFPCAACIGAVEQARALEAEYLGRIQVVFRIAGGGLAGEAAREAFAQQGTIALSAWHDRFADVATTPAADAQRRSRAELEKLAAEFRLDLTRFKSALDAHRHRTVDRMDSDAARQASIVPPIVSVDDYVLPGPQQTFALRRAIQHALNDAADSRR